MKTSTEQLGSPSQAMYHCSPWSHCHHYPLEWGPKWTQPSATRCCGPTENCILRVPTKINESKKKKKKKKEGNFPIISQLLKLVLQAVFPPAPCTAPVHLKQGENSLLWWFSWSTSLSPSHPSLPQDQDCSGLPLPWDFLPH